MEFDQVYQEYFSDVLYYLRSLSASPVVAEDLTQETFTKALRSISSFDGRKDIRAWLFTIAKNTYIDYCRKRKHAASEQMLETYEDPGPQFVEKLMDRETAFQIHEILHHMQEPYKEVFSLRAFGELSYDQIGKLFGKSSGWARVTFYRAKQKILECMEEKSDE